MKEILIFIYFPLSTSSYIISRIDLETMNIIKYIFTYLSILTILSSCQISTLYAWNLRYCKGVRTLGTHSTRMRTTRRSHGYFHVNLDISFFFALELEQWRSNLFSPELRVEIVGINAKTPLPASINISWKGDDEGHWFLSYREFHCNFIG